MNINEPFYFISLNKYLLDTESSALETTLPYDFYFPLSKWEERFNQSEFLGKREEFLDNSDIRKMIVNLFSQNSMRN